MLAGWLALLRDPFEGNMPSNDISACGKLLQNPGQVFWQPAFPIIRCSGGQGAACRLTQVQVMTAFGRAAQDGLLEYIGMKMKLALEI